MENLTIYDQSGQQLTILTTADRIGYELKHNDLWTAEFSLASGDPGNAYCRAHNLVKLPDGPRETGLFRIVGMPTGEEVALGGMRTYSLEHVMATLLDDVLFGYHEIGGTGIHTRDVMQYILDRQTVRRWVLGEVEFDDQFQYHFENVSLLSALLSLGEVLTDEYTWDFDTETTPWTVNLRKADRAPTCGIYYGRNMVSVQKTMDASALITRLYPLGYGEGVNQLTIKEVNGGAAYIDADTQNIWGVKCSVWTDTRIQDAVTLRARARQILEAYKNPYISYTARAVDLYRDTGYSWDDFMPGKLVAVEDSEHGINFHARIVSIAKRDVNGDPGDIEITIANNPRDAADSINTLADRVGIGELYSQGATNLFAIPFADNADPNHPAKFRVYIPQGMVRINKMLLSWQLQKFRAYSTGAADGGSTTRTSSSGGGSTQTTSTHDTVTLTSESGGETTITQPERTVVPSSSAQLGWTGGPYKNSTGDAAYMGATDGRELTTQSVEDHHHGMDHYHETYNHSHTVDSHSHGMDHYHETYNHSHTVNSHHHGMGHYHQVYNHYHMVNSHWHEVNSHWHYLNSDKTATEGVFGSTDSQSPATDSRSPYTTGAINSGEDRNDTADASPGTNSASPNTTGAKQSGSDRNSTGTSSPGTSCASPNSTGAKQSGHDRNDTGDAGGHSHTIISHSHGMDHFHYLASLRIPAFNIELPSHTHNVRIAGHSHSVNIPAHTHDVTLPDHTHGIVYGIYEGGRASGVTINVDGTDIPAAEITSREIDVSGYLSKDDNGKIRRGAWHEIQIVPDGLTRIEANLTAQVFVQSVGGGDY